MNNEQRFFFDIGLQYYASARFAAFGHFAPISGNLFHHSVEMLLKGGLVSTVSVNDLKKLGHALPKLWKRFKGQFPDPDLATHNQLIARLDCFESIRYPDAIVSGGAVCAIHLKRSHVPASALVSPRGAAPLYDLVVEEMDELKNVL